MNYTNPDYRTIGNIIKTLRTGKNWTQKNLAQNLGISFQSVSKWERGEVIALENLCAVANLFDVSIDYLMGQSKYRTMDQDAIGKLTGLSPAAVNALYHFKPSEDDHEDHISKYLSRTAFRKIDFINLLLSSDIFDYLISAYLWMCEAKYNIELAEHYIKISDLSVPPYHEYERIHYKVGTNPNGDDYLEGPEVEQMMIIQAQDNNYDTMMFKSQRIYCDLLDEIVQNSIPESFITELEEQLPISDEDRALAREYNKYIKSDIYYSES